jgi:hypothetical protein
VTEHPEIVVLETAPSPSVATIVVALLQAEGIPAYVNGSLLQDEFALSQRLLGLSAVEIQVPADRLAEAREVLAAAREAGGELAG